MASPPPAYSPAGSPPYPSHTQLPSSKKRGSSGSDLLNSKRRKTSVVSTGSRLRQTSFPPEDSQSEVFSPTDAQSPGGDALSVTGASQVSGAPVKKKRGRKSKADRAREAADEAARGGTPSVVGGTAASVISNASGNPKHGGGEDDGDGGRDEGGGGGYDVPETMASQSAARSSEQIKEEERLRALLKQRMTPEQFDRYEVWHKAKIQIGNVRKYINSVTSQSVQPTIPQSMQVVCKLFVGDMVEEARRVQQEWAEAGEKQTDLPDEMEASSDLAEDSKWRRQAPLRPEHLAEAYRRWKRSAIGGGTGGSLMAWNQQTRNGTERFAPRVGGKRLFR
ncbi:hTAFII28-like protein conserved region-domain-containing protein [Xylariales sp. PMI_506]|nr:hTAFII28-like protein conserved region-domain-containing protein [Xylariales sp. PMI_506]